MQDLIVSLSENILKVSTIENKEFKGVSADVTKEVVNDYKILNVVEFSTILKDLITTVTAKNPRSLSLNILIQPNDVVLKFVPVNKNGGDVEDQIINEINTKEKELPLEEMYFSYQKIAPFVYQFIGVKKDIIDAYIEVSNTVGIGLKSIIPWVMLLPKFTDRNEPSIYLTRTSGKQIVALSEFNGIFFSGIYEDEKSTQELQSLVQELSIYKRKDPITKVYIYDYENFSLNRDYEVLDLEIPNSDLEEAKGYEMHLLQGHMIGKDQDILVSQTNLINLLPVPVIQKETNKALVYAGALSLVLVVGGLIGGAMLLNKNREPKVLENTAQNTEVLSENNHKDDSQPAETQPEEVKADLNREDLTIRIENGAGIPGVAGRAQLVLEEFGYQVVGIGNAAEGGKGSTLIKIKADKAAYLGLLKEDMKDDFTVVTEEDLDTSSDYDALIVIGTDAKI